MRLRVEVEQVHVHGLELFEPGRNGAKSEGHFVAPPRHEFPLDVGNVHEQFLVRAGVRLHEPVAAAAAKVLDRAGLDVVDDAAADGVAPGAAGHDDVGQLHCGRGAQQLPARVETDVEEAVAVAVVGAGQAALAPGAGHGQAQADGDGRGGVLPQGNDAGFGGHFVAD